MAPDQIPTLSAGVLSKGSSTTGTTANTSMQMNSPTVTATPEQRIFVRDLKANPIEFYIIAIWIRMRTKSP
jgi:hypothetical protein